MNVTSRYKHGIIHKNQAHKMSLVFVVSFIVLLSSVGCAQLPEETASEVMDTAEYADLIFPVVWMDSTEGMFQPTFPTKTQLSIESINTEGSYFSDAGIELIFNSEEAFKVSYTYYSHSGSVLESGETSTEKIGIEQGQTMNIKGLSVIKPKENDTFVLEVVLQKGATQGYVYFPLIYTNILNNTQLIQNAYEHIQNYLQETKATVMGEIKLSILASSTLKNEINAEFTMATRLEEGFDYHDITLVYLFDVEQSTYRQKTITKVDKQRYVFSKEKGGWDLGQFLLNDQANDTRVMIKSKNEQYYAVFNQNEVVLYDVKNEELFEVYRIDRFDSDYVVDEYANHQIHLFTVSDTGEVYFAVKGYINDASMYSQKTGIALYHYHKTNLEAIGFIEKGESLSKLTSYVNHSMYFNEEDAVFYIFDRGMLYAFDAKTGATEYIESYYDATFNSEFGLLYWQSGNPKVNGSINFISLAEKVPKVISIYTTGRYKHLLGVEDNSLMVGAYDIEDTYELLDGQVITPYKQVLVYDFSGNLNQTFEQAELNQDLFYSTVYFDETTQTWYSDIIERQFLRSSDYRNSRVRFAQTGKAIDVMKKVGLPNKVEKLQPVITENTLITHNTKNTETAFITKTKKLQTLYGPIQLLLFPPNDFYLLEDSSGQQVYFNEFIDALKFSKDKLAYTISHITYSEANIKESKHLFDSTLLKSEITLHKVGVIPQRPELPRGCEVTSLAILLDYYMEQGPDKMELAYQLKQSSMEKNIIDGFVQYANMHDEFAGSMFDVNKEGLGVYIEPVRQLAQNYVEVPVVNISGASFKQMLTFVSMDKPVLIIIPNRYQAVFDYAKEVWKTPSGYMEVSYQEHSVVVVGFDDDYVYYSDPSRAMIDKKPKDTFEAAWVSMGSQAMIVLD
jgi:uncharacterized protein YvpB